MLYATLKLLHVLSIVVWVGGMVFAAFSCARPRCCCRRHSASR
jgi:uncharacterized membrane protein